MPLSQLTNPNIIFFITDEQRFPQHWPEGWAEQNLPSIVRLQQNGLTFLNAFTAACECSPSRASMMTSTYPQQNGVEVTFTTALNPDHPTLANVLAAADPKYPLIWKGKWHLSMPVKGSTWTEADIANLAQTYDVQQWNPPDAGTSLSGTATLGGGNGQNDQRYVCGPAAPGIPAESVLDFINNCDGSEPFCLVVSLVNPHDIFLYAQQFEGSGYEDAPFEQLCIELPDNQTDDLTTKPGIQLSFRTSYNQSNPLTPAQQANYVKFYAYLQTLSDALFCKILDALAAKNLIDNSIIFRFADHGEMALSHGMQEKMYNAYEESMHIPLIISNPVLFPEPAVTTSLASSLDLVPTIAEIVASGATETLRGTSLVPIINDPGCSVHEYGVVYTYDDQFNQPATLSGHIRCLRTPQWKYAVYYSLAVTGGQFEYELYDMANDPGELTNLAYGTVSDPNQQQWNTLHEQLTNLLTTLGPLPTGNFTWPVNPAGSNVWSPVTAAAPISS
ncbi:MAG: hypothetical protein QOC81_2501 [Thermoanaerobaculia bacterium]|jgi:arylsulfatase A-like enzyme|nr:hypothetical protein [Thermoanaerobaculia bacterium]